MLKAVLHATTSATSWDHSAVVEFPVGHKWHGNAAVIERKLKTEGVLAQVFFRATGKFSDPGRIPKKDIVEFNCDSIENLLKSGESSSARPDALTKLSELLKSGPVATNPESLTTGDNYFQWRLIGATIFKMYGHYGLQLVQEIEDFAPILPYVEVSWRGICEFIPTPKLILAKTPISPASEIDIFKRIEKSRIIPADRYFRALLIHGDKTEDFFAGLYKISDTRLFQSHNSSYGELFGRLNVSVRVNGDPYILSLSTGTSETWIKSDRASENLKAGIESDFASRNLGGGTVMTRSKSAVIAFDDEMIVFTNNVGIALDTVIEDENSDGVLGLSLVNKAMTEIIQNFTVIPYVVANYKYIQPAISADFTTYHVPMRILFNTDYDGACENGRFVYMPVIEKYGWTVEVDLVVGKNVLKNVKVAFETSTTTTIFSKEFGKKVGVKGKLKWFPKEAMRIGIKIGEAVFEQDYGEDHKYFGRHDESLETSPYAVLAGWNFMNAFVWKFDAVNKRIGICKPVHSVMRAGSAEVVVKPDDSHSKTASAGSAKSAGK
jgi:hypothetical protein